jgi:hypothetical protein
MSAMSRVEVALVLLYVLGMVLIVLAALGS